MGSEMCIRDSVSTASRPPAPTSENQYDCLIKSELIQKIQCSLALEPAHQGETPVGDCQGTEPVVAKPAPQSPALAPTPCRCPSLTPSNRRVRDPYARWCGRGGTARCPPIPIMGHLRSYAAASVTGCRAPIPAIRASESESGTATDTRRSAQCNLVAPSTFVLPSTQVSRGPVPYGFRNAVSAS